MVWKIEITASAAGDLKHLDKQTAARILLFLKNRVATLENPRSIGEALQGTLKKYWKYRVGNWRIVTEIRDDVLVVAVVKVGHRREVYRH